MSSQAQRQIRIAVAAASVAVLMVGAAYAAVPLYRVFCQVTGYGGTPRTGPLAALPSAADVKAAAGHTIRVRFDGNVRDHLPWNFKPSQEPMDVKIGEQNIAYFHAHSNAATATTGSATFNISPPSTARYFVKLQCFCFSEQTLKPGESVEMPVVFFVDPAILDDENARSFDEITLSYSFYPVKSPSKPPGIRTTGDAGVAPRPS